MLQRYTHLKARDMPSMETAKVEPVKTEPVTATVNTVEIDAKTFEQFKQFQAMMAMMNKTEEV